MRSHTLAPDSCVSPAIRAVIVGEGGSQFAARSRRHMLYRVGCCYPCVVILPQRLVRGGASSALDVECVSPVCRMPAVIEVFQFSVPCRLRCRQSSTQGFLGPFSTSPTARLLCAGDTNASLRSPCIAGFQALPRGGAESDFSALD